MRTLHAGHLVLAGLFLLCLFLGWRAVAVRNTSFADVPAFSAPNTNYLAILAAKDPFFPAQGTATELPVTALPFTLHGVRVDVATGQGSAFIATGDGEQKLVAAGEMVGAGVQLVSIAEDHVILDNNGKREALWLDSGEGAVQSYNPSAAPAARIATDDLAEPDGAGSDVPETEAPFGPNASQNDRGAAVLPAAPPPQDN